MTGLNLIDNRLDGRSSSLDSFQSVNTGFWTAHREMKQGEHIL